MRHTTEARTGSVDKKLLGGVAHMASALLAAFAGCSVGQVEPSLAVGGAPVRAASAGPDGPTVTATFRPSVKRVALPASEGGVKIAAGRIEFDAALGLRPGDVVLVGQRVFKLGAEVQATADAPRAGARRFEHLQAALDEIYLSLVLDGRFARAARSPDAAAPARATGPPSVAEILCTAPATVTTQLPGLSCGGTDSAGDSAGRGAQGSPGFALTLRSWDALDPGAAALCRVLPGRNDGVTEWECQ